jgi:hypothetical protein
MTPEQIPTDFAKVTVEATSYYLRGNKMKMSLQIRSDKEFNIVGSNHHAMVHEIFDAVQNIFEKCHLLKNPK